MNMFDGEIFDRNIFDVDDITPSIPAFIEEKKKDISLVSIKGALKVDEQNDSCVFVSDVSNKFDLTLVENYDILYAKGGIIELQPVDLGIEEEENNCFTLHCIENTDTFLVEVNIFNSAILNIEGYTDTFSLYSHNQGFIDNEEDILSLLSVL